MHVTRRHALQLLAGGLGAGFLCRGSSARTSAGQLQRRNIPFAFSLYGMRSLPVDRALRVCADIGYSGVELACMAGWPSDPELLTAADRKTLRMQLDVLSLDLPCLMENLRLAVPADEHRRNLERLRHVTQLAQDLRGDGQPPVIETVLGGRPQDWPMARHAMLAALGDWEKVAARAQVVLAIKAHVSGALHRPDDTLGLVREIRSPWIKAVYDFSHFERQGMELRPTLQTLLPETVFIHVKDNITTPDGKIEFALPGDGLTDYREYLRLLREANYEGAVCVEVSAQVSGKPGYNPIIAAERCYLNLRGAFEIAGLRARI